MKSYTNDKAEEVVIADMDDIRLIHAIAKYSRLEGAESVTQNKAVTADLSDLVKALKAEAIQRLFDRQPK